MSNLEAGIQIRYENVPKQSRLQEGPLGAFSGILLGAIMDTCCVCVCLCFPMCVCVPVCIVHAIYRSPQVLAKILSNLEAWIQIRYKSVLTQSRLQEGPLGVFSRILLGAILDNCCVRMFVFPCVCVFVYV